jgi:hypothetical protein
LSAAASACRARLAQGWSLRQSRRISNQGYRQYTEQKALMIKLGYKLMAEEHDPNALVRNGRRAE